MKKLPFTLRQKWREHTDCIKSNKVREINLDDIVGANYDHPIFGKLSSSKARDVPGGKERYSFLINVNRIVAKSANWEILKLNQNDPSPQCAMASISPYDAIAFKSNQLRDVSFRLKEWGDVLHVS